MAKIACPGCKKVYELPESASGKTATCKQCGQKFRVRIRPSHSPAAAKPNPTAKPVAAAASTPRPKKRPPVAAPSPPAQADDDFWDDGLKPLVAPSAYSSGATAGVSAVPGYMTQASIPAEPSKKPAKKKSRKKRAGWGVQWERVGGGAASFLIFGGITIALLLTTDRLFFWPAGLAVVGLLTMLSGLMGKEGIW